MGKAIMKRSAEERRLLVELTRQALAEHKGDQEILNEVLARFDLDGIRELTTLKRMVRDEERGEIEGRSAMDSFLDYRRDMLAVARKLDEFVEDLSGKDVHQGAIPTALRAKADIIDKVFTRGQEAGVIQGRAAGPGGVLVGGLIIGDLSDADIVKHLHELQAGFRELVKRVSAPMLPGGYRFTKSPEELGEDVVDVSPAPAKAEPEKKRSRRKRPVRRRPV